MSMPQGEYQIPQTEYAPSQPEIIEASPVNDVPQTPESLVRGSEYYENRAALIGKEIEDKNERQVIIALGNDIFANRQAAIENRLVATKVGVMKRAFDMIMTGQINPLPGAVRSAGDTFRDLMNQESRLGSTLIEVPENVSRQEFFLSDSHPNEWFYHAQSSINPTQSRTIHYLVSEQDGIFKSIDRNPYQAVSNDELTTFIDRAKKYAELVNKNLYKKAS